MKNANIRIGYDAKRIVMNDTGMGSYGRILIHALAKNAPDVRLLLSAAERGKMALYADLLEYDNVRMLMPPKSIWRHLPYYQAYWRNRGSLPQLRGQFMDLYHGVGGELPGEISSLDCPAVLTMHDLAYEVYPEFYSNLDKRIYRYIHERSLEDATHVVAVSENTKNDLMNYYNVSGSKITVCQPGCSEIYRKKLSPFEINKIIGKYMLPAEYILYVGTLEKRKNAGLIVKALTMLQDQYTPLVMVGRHTPYVNEIKLIAHTLGVDNRVMFLEGVPNEDLPALYQGASVFVFPSLYEGFGMPILEALCSGIPVVAAEGSSMEEAGGPATLYCDPEDPVSLAALIDEVMTHPKLRREMVAEGREWSKKYTLDKLATKMMDIYYDVLEKA